MTKGKLSKKYGKWGRVLGSGSSGTVRLIERKGGGVFAAKEFRRRSDETEMEYQKQVVSEHCVGSTLMHRNIIKVVDIVSDQGHYYEIMEYAPVELLNVVMSGKMHLPEVYCVFRQICDGVKYMHSMGLAHRDLKLDNCVMTTSNVVKLIDFGTAYPAYLGTHATGIVGSDPYLAPEVLSRYSYDPRKADVWSVGIIFVCMVLRKFPWKTPDPKKDATFRKFVNVSTPDTVKEDTLLSMRAGNPDLGPMSRGSYESAFKDAHSEGSDSVTTLDDESIFHFLPRQSRPALRRMLSVEPSTRCTVAELIMGKGKTNNIPCRCSEHELSKEAARPGVDDSRGGHCEDHDCEEDGWLKSVVPCLGDGPPDHVHVNIVVDQKQHKRWVS